MKEIEVLNRLAQTIASASDLESAINAIISEAIGVTGAHQGSILLSKEQAASKFTTLIRIGEDKHEAIVKRICMVVAGWVLRESASLLVADIRTDMRFKGLALFDYPMRSVLAVPVQQQGDILAVLVLHNTTEEVQFGDQELYLANIIASQAAPIMRNIEKMQLLKAENRNLRRQIALKYSFSGIIGSSPAMTVVFKLLEKVIPTDTRILIEGESGTGKELIAKAIHYDGPRKKRAFVAIDCGALPENLLESELFGHVKGAFTGASESKKGLFETADGGTLFLDEINNTTAALQAKLLRVIQEGEVRPVGGTTARKVNVRVLCATNHDLKLAVREGLFREDLYFRINVLTIKLPPLRERKEDIPLLVAHFLTALKRAFKKRADGFTREAMALLCRYDWPGNVRQLENVIERSLTLAEPDTERIDPTLLPDELIHHDVQTVSGIALDANLAETVENLERQMVLAALQKYQGNRSRAAESLGLSRRGLINKIQRYKLSP
jgi:transcriptional regulator with GAF, ATPase, and Fis domain